ncbi:MAG TPA: VTT domain-containing protein, partial [Gemmatimonadales bacterium]|nr:VTT domain-containing protein [Gemmatimonadales bacterium]
GIVRGTALVLLGATLGATAAFLLARHVARGFVARRVARHARLAAFDRALAADGFRLVLLLRLSPVVPFSVLNYALGLTQVRLRDFVLASIGMVPGTLLYVWSGKLAGDVARAAAGSVPRDATYWAVLGLGLAATLAAAVLVARSARRALAEVERGDPRP